MTYSELWWESMRAKHPAKSDDEIKEMMASRGRINKGKTKATNFARDPEKAREAGRLGAQKRWSKANLKEE